MNHSLFPSVQLVVVLRGRPQGAADEIFGSLAKDFMMSGNTRQIFHGITRIRVATPKGEVEKDGITIHWNYDAKAELLEVECRAPFWINSTRVNRDLRHEIEATCRSTRAA
jgi:hypothetical protein